MLDPASPLLDHCPQTLPARAYFDADWYAREMRTIWARDWVYAGRLGDLPLGVMRRVTVGAAPVILCRDSAGVVTAFHNVCRHRGAELCSQAERPLGKLITCPYHAWAYGSDGRLISVGKATPGVDFRREDHGLLAVQVQLWNGFIYLSTSSTPPALLPDMGLATLDNWPMERLITGHRMVTTIACNWKVFWENYNECLHCPGIHPELCDMVPIYRQGVMADNEAPGWRPDSPVKPNLKPGAVSWTVDGAACGPEFAGLTAAQRAAGYTFVTVYPAMFVVGHVDYVRVVSVRPTGPETTELTAEWLFTPETMAQPGFDAAAVAAFAAKVLVQDAAACEMNQRGLRSPAYTHGRLMPQEYAIHQFHQWVTGRMQQEDAR
ncbi:MAG: aromatic ring-hydroxylating dioxygenase subunit alpha [Paracoccaceae bacterium]